MTIYALLYGVVPLIAAWLLDLIFGDPAALPHPVVGFGKIIAYGERRLNYGSAKRRLISGAIMSICFVAGVFFTVAIFLRLLNPYPPAFVAIETLGIFFCIAGTTLRREVKMVFEACGRSLEEGRHQVARIVGRDTASLSDREVKTAALETLAENLSDGVVAPLFWYALLGLPGMMAYKMVNTLDSMIGYKSERYKEFGCFAARLDDVANFLPARLTACMMATLSLKRGLFSFIRTFGRCHASPNSGYPEAALAGVLDCRFGGTHDYFGKPVYKPYIGVNSRELTKADLQRSLRLCLAVEALAVVFAVTSRWFIFIDYFSINM